MQTIQIPFCGFYESAASQMIDDVINQSFDYEGTGDAQIPEDFYDHWGDGNKAVEIAFCKLYVERFVQYLKNEADLEITLEFDDMVSPKFYNFETDRIFCKIKSEDVQKLFDHVNTPSLRTMVRERHTSRSGFWSYYSNDLDDKDGEWGRPLNEWDSVQLQTLLMAFMEQEGVEDDTWRIMEDCTSNGKLDNVVWGNCSRPCLDMVNEYYEQHRR